MELHLEKNSPMTASDYDIDSIMHQEAPYLMISKLVSVDEKKIVTEKHFSDQDFFLKGHFPGAPVVPGAMMQEMCTQAAGLLISIHHNPTGELYDKRKPQDWALGVLNKVEFAKYLSLVFPKDPLTIEVELIESEAQLFKFRAKVKQNDRLMAKLKFNLVNIQAHLLEGLS